MGHQAEEAGISWALRTTKLKRWNLSDSFGEIFQIVVPAAPCQNRAVKAALPFVQRNSYWDLEEDHHPDALHITIPGCITQMGN